MNNFTNKLYILSKDRSEYLELIKQSPLEEIEITEDPSKAEIVLADPPLIASQLDIFTQLDWLQSTFAGIDSLVSPELRTDYSLTNVKGIFGQQISEYVIGQSLNYFRHFARYQQQQADGHWQPHQYQSLNEKSILILGCGDIGSHLGRVCNAFGMKTGGVNSSGIPPKTSPFKHTFHISELHSVISDADIIVNTLPNTPLTENILNKQVLSQAQQALLFNVGRGEAVDDPALSDAIASGCIAHAYLDVFREEPLPKESPLWENPKITLTPHIAALSFPSQVFEQFSENYNRWRDGFRLTNLVDFDKGY
ncbi:D-2-hydroxyacid dehydrogenase [Vibrio tapetis subsp. quintayensis]|uniref:D-2-hydroxyacid dehydrogenase n=1 Tax=Vibrio tapetis TaxID=52443 RepID=UPI0025B4D089|nr:D-2-hydroxyacid dehydrogenase [Vibrio tapetis]MDN3678917.1 D-2-hydroxyacid dehydrogenase [Vibrio tapetis subsp. quintayensis]